MSKSHQVQPGVGTLQEALNRAPDGSELVLAAAASVAPATGLRIGSAIGSAMT